MKPQPSWLFAAMLAIGPIAWAGLQSQTFISPMPAPVDCQAGALQYNATTKAFSCGSLSGGALPSGAIVLIDTGACPAGTTEIAAMDGTMPLGTLNANANVGTTGGSDTVTPTGAISWPAGVPTATGTAVSAHTGTAVADHASHTHTYTDVIAHTHTLPVGATDDTAAPFDRADAGTNTAGANATTASGSTGVATGTTAGPSATLTHSVTQPSAHSVTQPTIAWPAGVPTIAAGGENRSAFRRVIFCKAT